MNTNIQIIVLLFCTVLFCTAVNLYGSELNPFADEVRLKIAALKSDNAADRQRAAEALGYMRAYSAEDALIAALNDEVPAVRRAAALSLAWCGSEKCLTPLRQLTKDPDWTVCRTAEIAAENAGKITEVSKLIEISEKDKRKEVIEQLTKLPEKGEPSADEKFRIQSILRLLGRSQYPEALPVLLDFLKKPQWARYAADALGDYAQLSGNTDSCSFIANALLDVFPSHARHLTDAILKRETPIRAAATPPEDVPHLDSRDRILAVPYAIMFSLSRIDNINDNIKSRLKELAPLITQQIPLDIDRLVFYQEEPFQKIIRYLLMQAGVKEEILERAFDALADSPQTGKVKNLKIPPKAVSTKVQYGGGEPVELTCDISHWQNIFLIVDTVDDYSMDRANWADAKLVTADGETVFIDSLEPVFNKQEHDKLLVNKSSAFSDLRIGTKHFDRGLHTHAFSIIQYKLDGKYVRFTSQTGVCASRNKGQGSVRFIVSPSALEQNLPHNAAFNSNVIAALCREPKYTERLITLLEHPNHWVRINITKTLLFTGSQNAVPALRTLLENSKTEADFGEFAPPPFIAAKQGQDEWNDPVPCYREALIMTLGGLKDEKSVPLLIKILNDDKNSLGIRHRACLALGQILPANGNGNRNSSKDCSAKIIQALQNAERNNPFHSIRLAAREELWRHNAEPLPHLPDKNSSGETNSAADAAVDTDKFVFIDCSVVPPNNPFQMDSWRQCYMTTDSGPVYRPGDNLFVFDAKTKKAMRITNFTGGYVAECEVSYDGRTIWFTRREKDSPWYHLFRINADGSGLKQMTSGPFHDVSPVELPGGRIAFSTTRLGTRDEYHGYPCTGLATMNPDGSDIQMIGLNFGRDAEPAVADNGKIIFTRLELFYSRMKTEYNLLEINPDGTRAQTLYGPERRTFWKDIHGGYGNWFAGGDMSETGGRHRVLRLTQPQAFPDGRILLTTPAGPVLTQGRTGETLLRKAFLRNGGNDDWVITTAYPLNEKTLLVAAGKKNHEIIKSEFPKDGVALGIYTMDVATGELTKVYDDPAVSCFEARPLQARKRPPVLMEDAASRSSQYTGMLYCQSVFNTQDERVRKYGQLLRVVEALPQVTRHATQTIPDEFAWKNHGGAFGRDLGIIPLAKDGSFAVEVPADKFIALQVLDSDRNVVGNQLIWMNVRPGERKGCTGCHEVPDIAVPPKRSQAVTLPVPQVLPVGVPFDFHAKVWFKGSLSDEREQRQRTVQSANWFARP